VSEKGIWCWDPLATPMYDGVYDDICKRALAYYSYDQLCKVVHRALPAAVYRYDRYLSCIFGIHTHARISIFLPVHDPYTHVL
jgi:hypothetical protein